MYFVSWQALWDMSGHGSYVWSAYAISFLIILTLVIHPLRKKQQVLRAIQQRQHHEEANRGHAS